ncbi:hypothetical protein OIU34_17825 [Pararhizobium sp. BT-229]|uniref:hypothetical protein n=1 Tax=Pararhizobium sp. BT-229 TaxID=2986923 RepID=UPI0021F782E1|nr:hypothetical protein [Pararhizobium sp. BT-229]MCV9963737.1 hypothetical protein [Pararhizobium sp. BT-229]
MTTDLPGEDVTGVSAVNADGEVLVFCALPPCDLSYFRISGREMSFFSDEEGEPVFAGVYGRLTVDAASVRGDVVVCFPGKPVRYARVAARYGL